MIIRKFGIWMHDRTIQRASRSKQFSTAVSDLSRLSLTAHIRNLDINTSVKGSAYILPWGLTISDLSRRMRTSKRDHSSNNYDTRSIRFKDINPYRTRGSKGTSIPPRRQQIHLKLNATIARQILPLSASLRTFNNKRQRGTRLYQSEVSL